jgi:hypothetical protein
MSSGSAHFPPYHLTHLTTLSSSSSPSDSIIESTNSSSYRLIGPHPFLSTLSTDSYQPLLSSMARNAPQTWKYGSYPSSISRYQNQGQRYHPSGYCTTWQPSKSCCSCCCCKFTHRSCNVGKCASNSSAVSIGRWTPPGSRSLPNRESNGGPLCTQ